MIKGKAKMEFGTGDIRMTGALSGGIGALCCITQEPHEIGEKVPVEDSWDVDQAEVILTFAKTESIDALIAELQDVKAMMDGRYPFEKGRVRADEMDFDAFFAHIKGADANGNHRKIKTLVHNGTGKPMPGMLPNLQMVGYV